MGAGVTASLGQQCSRNVAKNIAQPWGCLGRGGLALRAHRDASTTSRSGEGGNKVNRRGPNPRGRCGRLSGAGSTADAGLARPNHAKSVLAPACRASSARTCRPGPSRCGEGGACPGSLWALCPARQHRLSPHPSCR